MFSNNRFFSKSGAKRKTYSGNAISYRTIYNHTPNPQANPKRMETKLFLIILSWVGIGSYIGGILLNLGTWKSDVLFFLAFLFGVVKFIRYSVKTWQDYRRTEIEIKLKRKEADE